MKFNFRNLLYSLLDKRKIPGMTLIANAVDAAILVSSLRLHEARPIGSVRFHNVRIYVLWFWWWDALIDDLLANQIDEKCEHLLDIKITITRCGAKMRNNEIKGRRKFDCHEIAVTAYL